jgi:hypothetical protein
MTPTDPGVTPDRLPADWRLQWDERTAIMEADGQVPPARAEALALLDILGLMRRHGDALPRRPPGGRPGR